MTSSRSCRSDCLKGLRCLDNDIALNVLNEYGIVPDDIKLIQSGTIKTVWKLTTGGRQLCLKRLKQTIDKALFSVNAQIYIKNSGGLVPGVVFNTKGDAVTEYNGQLFVVYEWIDGKDLNFSNPADLRSALQGLAHFHMASKGYTAPEGSRVSSKLGKWPDQYTSMRNKMASWKELAVQNSSAAQHSAYAANIDSMLSLADRALTMLSKSKYAELTGPDSSAPVLCHQDYGKGNALAAVNGVYVLDLDGVTFDLAARDLRKIIGKSAENSRQWSAKAVLDIIGWYSEVNRISGEELDVLYADLMYPHWFYGLVKNLYQNGKSLKASEIEKTALLESSKEEVLKLCFRRSD